MEKQYRNIGFLFLLFIPLTFFGFYKTYFILTPEFQGTVDIYDHVHGATASVWLALLIAQPLLIRFGNFRLHRLLGRISYVVFPFLILSFIPQAIKSYESGGFPYIVHFTFDVILLLIFYTLAIRNIKDVTIHMRYMIAITLIFIGPTLGRILYHWFDLGQITGNGITYGGVNFLLVGLIFWDKANNRNYQPFVVALVCFAVYMIALFIAFW
tara:strand:- start:887 stop:1522 length:636 start_codon:yes stop_codon:yes gene_type:complete